MSDLMLKIALVAAFVWGLIEWGVFITRHDKARRAGMTRQELEEEEAKLSDDY